MNYFNYFTEVEDHFRRARGSGMFMMSPLDWALVEAWKDAGIPLAAVLKGIDRAFERYRARPNRTSTVNSIAYCAQHVLGAAKETEGAAGMVAQSVPHGFATDQLADFLSARIEEFERLAEREQPGSSVFAETADSLRKMAGQVAAGELADLEAMERHLSVLQDRVLGVVTSALSEEQLLDLRRELDEQLRPYRRRMNAEQIALLEQRYLRRKSLEQLGLSTLSLFSVS